MTRNYGKLPPNIIYLRVADAGCDCNKSKGFWRCGGSLVKCSVYSRPYLLLLLCDIYSHQTAGLRDTVGCDHSNGDEKPQYLIDEAITANISKTYETQATVMATCASRAWKFIYITLWQSDNSE